MYGFGFVGVIPLQLQADLIELCKNICEIRYIILVFVQLITKIIVCFLKKLKHRVKQAEQS